ncbi:glycine oxidase ThiO [Notoacmeibacter sp. MSK16QG-6]|uniref:glycine oxidase ThiO n=1 Tax=Notoacmeibacter sp. MSK16QG-6 TaxID=2957982 RepID=UPI0020A0A260|nr:glycine oxidase ThiO [Notoacmeibacter sp. MSK16QG-6]MCP1200229.1 glycine oxidase ThiO [Notoacmeibacter sp. MSK16QG-6]
MTVLVAGAGVAGLVTALTLAEAGHSVRIVDKAAGFGPSACSWYAGGMLAPWIEAATQDAVVKRRGVTAIDWWAERVPVTRNGSLVVAPGRDSSELARFARRAEAFEWLDGEAIAALEPDLAGRFSKALFFADEAHLDPRQALVALQARLAVRGVTVEYGADLAAEMKRHGGTVIDCRGMAAKPELPALRGVRGEMLIVRCADISLSRPVRLIHPRFPCYVVPRGDGHFMIGATQYESERRGPVTVRGTVDLLNALYALHPGFAEAEVIETGADLRPAFPDNLPRVVSDGRVIHANGLFRHGFLLSPAVARDVCEVMDGRQAEFSHVPDRQRQSA